MAWALPGMGFQPGCAVLVWKIREIMKKIFFFISLLLFSFLTAFTQPTRPGLVVGIVVDQMRPDYLTRFYEQYTGDGFRQLMNNGLVMWNVHYNYIPTYTGPGHASIYSGTTPRYHGIVGNDIYNRRLGKTEYCVEDSMVSIVGNKSPGKGGFSPYRLLSTNIADELKLYSNKHSKVISLSLKDRAAILPAGHMADYALWFDKTTGFFVSSTFYLKKLPLWVDNFNQANMADQYSGKIWEPLLPENEYPSSIDVTPYLNKRQHSFPHKLNENRYQSLYESPYANSLLTDLAIEAIKNCGFGKGTTPDLLAISYSGTDAVGHLYGPNSKEVNDTYLRLDIDLARLIKTLDQYVGHDNYILFLTADHGVAEIPAYLKDQKVPSDTIDYKALVKKATDYLNSKLPNGKWINTLVNNQFFLNHALIQKNKLNLKKVQNILADFLREQNGIAAVYTASQLEETEFTTNLGMRVQNGYSPKRSGDLMLVLEPGWFEGEPWEIVTHGTGYSYDTNVPLIWFGAGITKGETWKRYEITDIAPTLSMILRINYPSASIGNPIPGIFNK